MKRRLRYESLALTAAVTGGDVLPSQSPHIPRGPEATAKEAIRAAQAGASSVHLHGREDDGRPTGSGALFREMVQEIRESCDVVINISTGGHPSMSPEERVEGVVSAAPEIASFNLGTMNYEAFPDPSRWPKVEHEWERTILKGSGNGVFRNTLSMMRDFAAMYRDLGVTPELEVYDGGHLSMARYLIDEGTLEPPVRVQFVLGVLGAADTSIDTLLYMTQATHRVLGDDVGSLGVAAVGYPAELRHAAVAMALGLDIRVGLEDNLRLRRDRLAESNAELVTAVSQLAELLGRPLMDAAEFRSSLGPWFASPQNVPEV